MADQYDLAVPTYVDTNSLLDLLASLEGGFSLVERLSSQESLSADRKSEVGGEFGVANVLNLLKLNLRGSKSTGSAESSAQNLETERYHTYGSLLYRLRGILEDEGLIKRPTDGAESWEEIGASDFVELHGVFRPNPLAESLATIVKILGIVRAATVLPDRAPKGAQRDERLAFETARATAPGPTRRVEPDRAGPPGGSR